MSKDISLASKTSMPKVSSKGSLGWFYPSIFFETTGNILLQEHMLLLVIIITAV